MMVLSVLVYQRFLILVALFALPALLFFSRKICELFSIYCGLPSCGSQRYRTVLIQQLTSSIIIIATTTRQYTFQTMKLRKRDRCNGCPSRRVIRRTEEVDEDALHRTDDPHSAICAGERTLDLLLLPKGDLLQEILSYLDVVSLVETKQVCTQWQRECTIAIDNKCGTGPQQFQTNTELKDAVRKYIATTEYDSPEDAEGIARTYGWPIGRWDVSQIEDFSEVFDECHTFNEDISRWDTSHATNMKYMFHNAFAFNQPLARWDTSRVTKMDGMFYSAASFNQPLNSWNTSRVKSMKFMLLGAVNFNQIDGLYFSRCR